MRPKDIVRFWSKVDKASSPNGCWLWIAGSDTDGYGRFKYDGSMHLVHRVSFELKNGPIPEGLQVHHDCPGGDNPACVNPDHLWLGTQNDNVSDMVDKGRQAKGERVIQSKLTQEDVEVIRHLYENKAKFQMTQRDIASSFGISQKQVSLIVREMSWCYG